MEVIQQTIIVKSGNSYKVLTPAGSNVLSELPKAKAQFKSNDWQIVPKFTNYSINLTNIPTSYIEAIEQMGTQLQQQIDTDRQRLNNIDDGTNTQIVLIKNANENLTAEFDTFKSSTQTSLSNIIQDKVSYAGLSEAINQSKTSLLSQINTEYPTLSYVGENLYTKTDVDNVVALKETLLTAQIDDMDAKYNEAVGIVIKTDGSIVSQKIETLTTSIGTAINEISTLQTNAQEWLASASKIISDENGNITGWSFADGSNIQSNFSIYADTFRIINTATSTTPFSIDVNNNLVFNGRVSFNNVDTGLTNISGDTVMDGNKIATGSITANQISAGSITTDHISTTGLNASVIKAGVIYNTGANESTYTMKVDFDNGEIHIK